MQIAEWGSVMSNAWEYNDCCVVCMGKGEKKWKEKDEKGTTLSESVVCIVLKQVAVLGV